MQLWFRKRWEGWRILGTSRIVSWVWVQLMFICVFISMRMKKAWLQWWLTTMQQVLCQMWIWGIYCKQKKKNAVEASIQTLKPMVDITSQKSKTGVAVTPQDFEKASWTDLHSFRCQGDNRPRSPCKWCCHLTPLWCTHRSSWGSLNQTQVA